MKRPVRALFLTLSALLSLTAAGSSARADPPDLRTELLAALDGMEEAGFHELGGLSLARLRLDVAEVSFHLVVKPFSPAAPYRDCAYYRNDEKAVFVGKSCWENSPPQVRLSLLFHEALGALGYDDENYQWSALLGYAMSYSTVGLPQRADWFMRKNLWFAMAQPSFRNRFEYVALRRAEGGGSATGVKGGGDPSSLETKIAMLGYIGIYVIQRLEKSETFDLLWETVRTARVESYAKSAPKVRYADGTLFVSRDFVADLETNRTAMPMLELMKISEIFRALPVR